MNIINLLEDTAQTTTKSGSNVWTYVIFGAVAVLLIVMMFINSRKRQKQAKEEEEKRSSLGVGSKIMTAGGVIGIIEEFDGEEFVLNTEGTRIRFSRRAIYTIIDEVKNAEVATEEVTTEETTEETTTQTTEDAFAEFDKAQENEEKKDNE